MRKDDLSFAHLGQPLANEKAASGKSAQTVGWHTGVIARYAYWLVTQQLTPSLAHFTLEDVRDSIVALRCQGTRARETHPGQPSEDCLLSDASINSYVRALRAFSSWLVEEGYTATPPLARLKAPKMTQKTQQVMTEEEIAAIAAALNPRAEIGARDQAIFLLLLENRHARRRAVRAAAAPPAPGGRLRGRAGQGAQGAAGQDRGAGHLRLPRFCGVAEEAGVYSASGGRRYGKRTAELQPRIQAGSSAAK